MGWQEQDLAGPSKCHPGKVRLAQVLRKETTMTLGWIAHRLQMGSESTLWKALQKSRD